VPIIRENSKNSQVGIALNLNPAYPASSSQADLKAAKLFDEYFNGWYLEPLYGKKYPKNIIKSWKNDGKLTKDLNFIQDDDFKIISEPTDFLGINYYSRAIIRCSKTEQHNNLPVEIVPGEKTKFDWEVFPKGLEELLVRINKDYSPKSIFITENGASYDDHNVQGMDNINDIKRIQYIESHLDACKNAINKGVPLKGYFCWSLMDNFEWAEGLNHRFGLIHVDFETQKRIPKNSYKWYREFLVNGVSNINK
jgi:beta-glucosidase